jgi:hypothetical protein
MILNKKAYIYTYIYILTISIKVLSYPSFLNKLTQNKFSQKASSALKYSWNDKYIKYSSFSTLFISILIYIASNKIKNEIEKYLKIYYQNTYTDDYIVDFFKETISNKNKPFEQYVINNFKEINIYLENKKFTNRKEVVDLFKVFLHKNKIEISNETEDSFRAIAPVALFTFLKIKKASAIKVLYYFFKSKSEADSPGSIFCKILNIFDTQMSF